VAPGVLEVSLARVRVTGRLRKKREVELIIASRRFREVGQMAEIARYAAELEELQAYCERGELGSFVRTTPRHGGAVKVALVERVWDGEQVRTEVLAERVFDAEADDAVQQSAAFAAELRVFAEERNDALEAALRDAGDDRERAQAAADERARSAQELAQILDRL
jgi:hypothetical protein